MKWLHKFTVVYSQYKVLCNKASLGAFINTNDEELKELIDWEVFSKLINREKVEISKAPTDSKYDKDEVDSYYITRTFNHQVKIKVAIKNEEERTREFSVTYNSKIVQSNLKYDQDIVLISNIDEDFKRLRSKYEKRNIHWLREEDNKLVWQQSQGSLSKLRKFVDESAKPTPYTPEKITDIHDKIVIISAEPGMGKSTVLTKLAQGMKSANPPLWVVRVNLNDHTSKLEEVNLDDNKDDRAINFFLDMIGIETSLKKELFKRIMNVQGKIALLFDGFDEITFNPTYKEKVIKLLNILLKNTKIKTLWVTTRPHMKSTLRPHMKSTLEDELSTLSYTLEPLSRQDQEKFLKDFWNKKLNLNIGDDRRLNGYIQTLLDLLKNSISDKEAKFTGIPLQIRMLAEAYQNRFEKFCDSDQERPDLPKKLDLIDLYDSFIEKKYNGWYLVEKKNFDLTKMGQEYEILYESFIKKHKLLALSALFSDDDLNKFLSSEERNEIEKYKGELEKGKENTGIVNQIIYANGKLSFTHRTYAEYFAVNWFADEKNLNKPGVKNFLREHIFKEENEVIRNFFDRMLAKDKEGENKYEIHNAVLDKDEKKIKDLLRINGEDLSEEDKNTIKNIIDSSDKAGRTGLHLAAAYGYSDIVQVLKQDADVSIADNIFDWRPLSYADKGSHWSTSELLLEGGANGNDMFEAIKNVKTPYERKETLLHTAAEGGYKQFAKVLVEHGANINADSDVDGTPLHFAAFFGHLDIVKYLVGKKANLNAVSEGESPLSRAMFFGHLDVMKYLIKRGTRIDRNLDRSTSRMRFDMLGYIEGREADLNKDDIWLHLFVVTSKLDQVQAMVKEGARIDAADNNGYTPLHKAAAFCKEDKKVVEYLVARGGDLNAISKHGNTPLHWAAYFGNLNIVKYLVKNKAKVNQQDINKSTPLHYAYDKISSETEKIVDALLSTKGIDVNAKNNEDVAPLYLATQNGHEKIVVALLNKKDIDVNVKNNENTTPLHIAAKNGHLGIVSALLKKKSIDVNAEDNRGLTPLHLAAKNGREEVVEILLKSGANFEAVATIINRNITPLSLAQNYDHKEIENILTLIGSLFVNVEKDRSEEVKNDINKGAIVNARNTDGFTAVHLAAKSGYLGVVEILLNGGADINAADKNGKTPLDLAQDEAVKKLLRTRGAKEGKKYPTQAKGKQQKSFIKLNKYININLSEVETKVVKQGLYLPSFESRGIKIDGKCAAITRMFSQGLFLGQQVHESFLSNLQTSAELYERLAQGKQISQKEEREIFDLSKLFGNFEQQLYSLTSSLPSSLSHVKSYKTVDDLSRYVSELTGDFAIHLVTSNHVVAIYRTGDTHSYFDTNVAFVSGLKNVDHLMKVLNKAVKLAEYEVEDEGFLVEHFDVVKANNELTTKQKEALTKPIQTERHLLDLQDQKLGYINLNGKLVSRVTLYDLGTKLHLEGSSPVLINADMSLNSENLLAYLNAGKVSITAREYLEKLKDNSQQTTIQEVVRTTQSIPFSGSTREVKNAAAIKELVLSENGRKLGNYELNQLLKSPVEKSLPYYLEVANSKHWPNRLTNAAGNIQLIRGMHGAVVSCDRDRGNTKDCLLNTGEISLSLVSQLIEDKIVQNVPKLIKSLKTVKFGAHILRGGAAIISSPFDIYDIIDSAIDLHNCEKGSNECKDAIAGVTFASTSLASGVVLTAIGAPGVGTAVGLVIMVAQGAYGGGRAIEEFQPYRLTFNENFRLFWHAFALQPVPADVEYIKARKDIVSQITKQVWEQLQRGSEHVIAHVTGLGDVTFKEERECTSTIREGSDRYQSCTHRRVRVPTLFPSNATVLMDLSNIKGNDYQHFLSRVLPDSPAQDAVMLCLPAFSGKDYEHDYTLSNGYPKYESSSTVTSYCENAMMIGDKQRIEQTYKDKKVVFDLNLVNQGVVVGSDKWQNDFIIYKGKTKVLGGENTRNTFILTSDSFAGTIFGGKNSTNTLDVSNLSSSNLYIDNLSPFDRTSYVQDYTTNKKQLEERTNRQAHFYGISNLVISANTTVAGNGDRYIFYIKPNSGYSKINVAKGSVVFPETALLLDCDSFTYSPESNVLSMKFSNFTLDIGNYFNREGKSCNFELIDKHGSTIEPLVDLAQSNSQEVKLFNLRTETTLTYNNITKWYEGIAKANKEYQVYGTVKVKYPIAQEKYGSYPNMIFGSEKSDIIPLAKETWYAEGRKGSDSYNVISDRNSSITTEINNYAEDGVFDLLYMPVNSIQVSRDNNNLHLHAADSTHLVKVKDYFVNSSYQHLTVIDENKDVFVPKENNQQSVQLVPFYHATKDQYMFSLSAEKIRNNSEIIVDAKLDNMKFYRDGSNLVLIDDKPIMVKLEGFYDKDKSLQNLTINFWHDHHKDKLDSQQLLELSKLAINYQDEIRNTYYDSVKEYIVPASNATIHHNQELTNGTLATVEPSTKRVGVLVLQDDIEPSGIEVSVNNEDLVFFVGQNNASFTIKNWDDTDHRISVLKFNQEEKSVEVTGLDKFDLSQVSEIQSLVSKAALNGIASQQLEKLDSNVANGIKYLLAVRGIENGISTYKCLGFYSVEEEWQFISAYHSRYSLVGLDHILGHSQGVEALVWLIVKGYSNLSLEDHNVDRRSLLNNLDKCFNAAINKRTINRIMRKLEVEDLEAVVPNVESFVKRHKEALEDKIVSSLRSNTTEITEDIEEHQRKRRDTGIVKDQEFFNAQNDAIFTIKNNRATRGHENNNDQALFYGQNNANSSLKGQQVRSGGNKLPSSTDLYRRKRRDENEVKGYEDKILFYGQNNARFTIKDDQATSGSSKLSSWINTAFDFATKGISQLGGFFSSTKASFPTINAEHPTLSSKQDSTRNNNATTITPHIDLDGTILLLDVLIRKITGERYVSSVNQSLSLLEAQGYALNITEEFEQVLKDMAVKSGISATNLNFNPVPIQSTIVGQIRNGKFSEISKTLYLSAKDACPEFKQTDKFLDRLSTSLKEALAEKEVVLLSGKQKPTNVEKGSKATIFNGKSVSQTIENKPKSLLSDIAIGNSTFQRMQ